jgi:tRNA pseudouridine synthase 10
VGTEECKFSAGGREDIDVRMLGDGRPFIVEFINPKTPFTANKSIEKIREVIKS